MDNSAVIHILLILGTYMQITPGYISRSRIAGHKACTPQTVVHCNYSSFFLHKQNLMHKARN